MRDLKRPGRENRGDRFRVVGKGGMGPKGGEQATTRPQKQRQMAALVFLGNWEQTLFT